MMRLLHLLSFMIFYITEVLKSNLRVAHDVLTPKHLMNPCILAVDVSGMTDRQLLFMANFITMTPGTLGLCFSDNKERLYIHVMYMDEDMEVLSAKLSKSYGKRVRHVF